MTGMDQSGNEPGSRALARSSALERAAAVSEELRRTAKALRASRAHSGTRPTLLRGAEAGFQALRTLRGSRAGLVATLFGAVLPALAIVIYFSLIASSQYTAEARFAVKGGEKPIVDAISAVTGLSSITQAQDSLIVVNYLKSRAIVEELEKRVGLRAMFSRSGIDWISRFNPNDPIEDLVSYWRWKVKPSIEMPSGVITVEVSAFSPQDTLRLAETVVALSEELINTMSARARNDAVADAERDLARAERRLASVRIAMRDLRNQEATLDPKMSAKGIDALIGELRLERIRLEQELAAAARANIAPNAPQTTILRSRLEVVNNQTAELERQLTTTGADGGNAVSGQIGRFEALELERQIAEKQYTLAAASLEQARITSERQQAYLSTFVQPLLPEDPSWPKRFWFSLAGVVAVFVLYGAGLGIWGALRPKKRRESVLGRAVPAR